ncbi:ATP-binding cassette domain-containing protein [Fluviispira vulneris]|uniref:ATP-binding cassette domain-containing protein n=1 Tax=Fluviispira vulneris TaxID=2763012 RepID=UPI001C96368B|nr:ATP-binding cassette domain-containing protein [Fluviispira vulneris]
MQTNIVLNAHHLSKKFKKKTVINDLSFSLEKGSVVGFLGPNGSDKTTTLRLLTGLLESDSGNVEILGCDLKSIANSDWSIGAIIEKPDFYLSMTDYENLYNLALLSENLNKGNISQRIVEVIDIVGLSGSENKKVKNYSLGMKQRLGIAQALLSDPEILILDEPTNGIDPIGLRDLRTIIKKYSQNSKKTFLISSHMINELEDIFTHLVIINKGQLV